MQLSRHEVRQEWACIKRKERHTLLLALAGFVLVFLLCMCFRYNAAWYPDKFVPLKYAKSLLLAVKSLYSGTPSDETLEAAGLDSVLYLGSIARLKLTLMSLVAGAALAISGAVFQTAYRNPMASPNIIGATAGVKLGNALVVMLYSYECYDHILLRYKFCYGLTALCVCGVLLLGKLSGSKYSVSVLEMVMAGSIVSQALNVVSMYIMYNLEDEDLLLYQEISMGLDIDLSAPSLILFFGVMLISILPVVLTRYRLNVIGMDQAEAETLGVRTAPLRLVGQLCGVLMVTCAMIHCGEVGMLSMVIPCVMRNLVGSDFRKLCVYSALTGGVLLMLCRLVSDFFLIAGEAMPVTFFVNLVLMPAFMVILARQKGRQL